MRLFGLFLSLGLCVGVVFGCRWFVPPLFNSRAV